MACTCTQFQLVMVVLAVLTTSSTGMHIVYHVKPNSTYKCSSAYKYCHTLAHYVQDVTHFFASYTTMVFLPGTHILPPVSNSQVISIHNVRELALEGSESLSPFPIGLVPEPSSKIQCNGSTGIEFISVNDLRIRSLTFSSCGSEHPHHSYYKNSALAFMMVSLLRLSSVMVRNNTGYGVYASNTRGISIINSTFAFNSGKHDHYGGNVQLHYNNSCTCLHIRYSRFLYGNYNYKDAATSNYPQASGLMIMLESSNVHVMIDHVILSGNIGGKGGNLAIEVKNTELFRPIHIDNSYISDGQAYDGGGVHLSVVQFKLHGTHGNADILNISNTHIVHNHAAHRGGGFFMYTSYTKEGQELQAGGTVTIENCDFYNNSKGRKGKEPSSGGAAIDVSNFVPGYIQQGMSKLNFINDTFSHSYDACDSSSSAAAIFLNRQPRASFTDCNFTDNACTAMVASRTNVLFQGYATVERNNGSNGGGLLLCEGSLMYLFPKTTVLFLNNHAKLSGGAIYVEDTYLQTWPPCFFQLKVNNGPQTLNYLRTVHIHFYHNSAEISGNALYGGSVDRCFLMQYLKQIQKHTSTYAFNKLFSPKSNSSDHSYISSDPVRVCFCDNNIPNCSSTKHSLQVFPGQKFMISVVVVGQRSGAVPGIVLAKYSSLPSIDNSQVVNSPHCTKLQYTAYSRHASSSEYITLTAHKPGSATSSVKPDQQAVKVHVSLKTCTLGFTLVGDHPLTQHCGCVSKLEENGFNCSISNNKNSTCTILRETPVVPSWIGVCSSKNTTEKGLLYYGHCPFDFCKIDGVDIVSTLDTLDQDAQCAYKRRGILCGKCQHKFSLTLGSSKCHKCSDYSLLTIIVFATAGLLLVIFLTACNITVSEGTINGLIFYANIVQMNWANYFPTPQPHFPNGLTHVLSVFVAWVNLDLGIETCFYNGMDAYAKTWLQFVFPIYLWVIAGIIVLLSRKYSVIARATGKHAVQVLATLILLSFVKLLRTVIAALSYAILHCSTGSGAEHTERVWLSDGSIGYLQGKHIPLFIATILIFLMLSLPYTLTLVFIQCLQKSRISWIWRLKPLFDAYTAPYKDNYRFWTGHLLLVRITLLGATFVNDPTVSLLIVIAACSHIIMLSVLVLRGVYKKWTFDILETSFVLNLGVLSAATVAFSKNNAEAGQQVLHRQAGLVCTSVGIAFTTFLGILFFHTCKQITRSTAWKNLSARISNSQRELEPLLVGDSCPAANKPTSTTLLPPPTLDHSDQYREPVLGYEDT